MDNNLVSQVAVGAIGSYALQVLKQSKWFPWLNEESAKIVKIFFAVVASVCAATGLGYAYDANAHTLLITNFSLSAVATALWHWFQQFVVQEGWYQVAFNKPVTSAAKQP